MAAVHWDDEIDEVLGGDLTAGLAYVTPAGGTVVTAVAPIGLRDRDAGTVGFTTSLGFGKKLDRIRRNPRVALAFHAREHGFCESPRYVLVQGDASFDPDPSREYLDEEIGPRAERFMGPRKQGRFWDRWLQEYYADRVPVHVRVERIVSWPSLRCEGDAEVTGAPLPEAAPEPQAEPKNGAGPRVDSARAAKRISALPYRLLGYLGADGYPVVVPVDVDGADARGMRIASAGPPLPAGGRRAGVLAHDYREKLIGLEARQHTGWLTSDGDGSGVYAPHTEAGFRAPANKTLLLLANGFMAKRGLRRARRAQAAA